MTRKPSSAYLDHVIKEYAAGKSAAHISQEIGYSIPTVTTMLKRAGIAIRGNVAQLDENAIVTAFDAGARIKPIAASHGVTFKVIHRILRKHGRDVSRPLIQIGDTSSIAELHATGVGVMGIAKHFGTSAEVITRHLLDLGLTPRNRSEQQFARMENSSPETINSLVAAANAASKGRTRALSERVKHAATRYKNGSQRASESEHRLCQMLSAKGFVCDQQTPIGPYNCDITTNSVAVEVWGGGWHFHGEHLARLEERMHYILNQGWHIVCLVVDGVHPLTDAVADHLAAEINKLGSDPAAIRQYRVIWGAGDKVAGGSAQDDKITIKPSLVDPL